MKILVTTPYFYPHSGGSQNYIANLYSTLVKNHPEFEVDVICYNTDSVGKRQKYRGLNVYRVGTWEILPGQFALPNYFELFGLIRKLKRKNGSYGVVNAHTRFFDNALWSPLAAKYLGAKSILTDHCASSPRHSSRIVSIVAKIVDFLITPLTAMLYDDVVVVSQATKKYLARSGIGASKVFYGGVDAKKFTNGSSKKKRYLPKVRKIFDKKDIIVVFLGRMIPSKGPQVLLDAANEIVGKSDNVHFVFAGKGEALEKLRSNIIKNVYFTGELTQPEAVKLLGNSDILVLPTKHHEGFPLSLLEAGASGCAVVATKQGGIGELIKDNRTGVIVSTQAEDVAKKLEKLIKNKKLRENLAKNLQKKVKAEFDWSIISEKYYKYLNF